MLENIVVEIVEQPAEINERFRYKCEGKSVVLGVNSVATNRTYPAIRVLNYTGSAVVVVSCVTTDKPYRPHPNNLIGKTCCKGVCKIDFQTDETAPTVITFNSIGIQCCKKTDIETVLSERESLRIDPFKTGFKHKNQKINLTAVRLCFQVILRSATKNGKSDQLHPIPPVVSDIIRDKKYIGDFKICDISDTSSPATGGKKIVIFCDRVARDDIKIRFYRENEDKSVSWEAWGHFEKNNVHHQVAIAFKTPAYETIDIDEPVNVLLQMVRPSDDRRSESRYFKYVPDYSNINHTIKNKKRKIMDSEALFQYVQGWGEEQRSKRKIEININPDAECNDVPNGFSAAHVLGAAAQKVACNANENRPMKLENAEVTPSNLMSNFSCEGAVGPAPSNQLQQSYFQSQRFEQSVHPQNSDFYGQRRQLEGQISTSQNRQLQQGYIQHSQIHQPSHGEYQSFSHLSRRLRDDKPLNVPNEFRQQPQLNVGCVGQQQQQQLPEQYHPPPSNFYQMYSNPGYIGKNLSSSANYNPLGNYQNAYTYPHNSMLQYGNQFSSNNNNSSTTVQMQQQQQILCDNNFNVQEIIEDMSGSFGSLVIETIETI